MPSFFTPVMKFMNNQMIRRYHHGGKAAGMDGLVLTTVGAKTGQRRQTLLGTFPDGDGAWLVVASAGGATKNPAWYHNLAAHPDQAQVEVGGKTVDVTATQLAGQEMLRRLAAHHRRPAPLRRLREEDRPRHAGHPPHGGLAAGATTRRARPSRERRLRRRARRGAVGDEALPGLRDVQDLALTLEQSSRGWPTRLSIGPRTSTSNAARISANRGDSASISPTTLSIAWSPG